MPVAHRNLQPNDGDKTTRYLFINNDNNDKHIKMTASDKKQIYKL